jgi:hypothetical protein
MPGEYSYAVRGALMKCSCGSCPMKINLPLSHGAFINNKPMLNEADNKVGMNITPFGACTNIKVCAPNIPSNWVMTKMDTKVEGKPALTNKSKLICANGGVIEFLNDGQMG